jgi:hypothetical protein
MGGEAEWSAVVDPETRAYLDELRRWLETRFGAIDRRFDGIDRRFVDLDGELRRHVGVLIEDVRHDLRAVTEIVVANTEAIAQLRLRLDAR